MVDSLDAHNHLLGWFESDNNLYLWRKFNCPVCKSVISIKQDQLQDFDQIKCADCSFIFKYELGHLFPPDIHLKLEEEKLYPDFAKEIFLYYNTMLNVIRPLKVDTNATSDKHSNTVEAILEKVKFVYGIMDYKLEAYAQQPNIIYISNMLVTGISDFFLSFLSQKSFLLKDDVQDHRLIIERSSEIQLTPSYNPKQIIKQHLAGKFLSPTGCFHQINFGNEYNYFVYRYFRFLAFCFVFLHELAHIYCGHLDRSRIFSKGWKHTESLKNQAFEVEADMHASNLFFYITRRLMIDQNLLSPILKGHLITEELPKQIGLPLSILMGGYVPLLVPYYLSAIAPVMDLLHDHPPAILRSYFCQNILNANFFKTPISEEELDAIRLLWEIIELRLINSDYCGEQTLIESEIWKNKKELFLSYLKFISTRERS